MSVFSRIPKTVRGTRDALSGASPAWLLIAIVFIALLVISGEAATAHHSTVHHAAFNCPTGARARSGTVSYEVLYDTVAAKRLRMDIYAPAGARNAIAVMDVHGGAWRSGDKVDLHRDGVGFACAGMVAFIPNFRKSCVGKDALCGFHFPAPVHDLHHAIGWIRDNAHRYGGASRRIGVAGTSSGGHLAEMMGVGGGPARDRADVVVAWSAPNPHLEEHSNTARFMKFIGCTSQACPQRWREASPDTLVNSHSAEMLIYNSAHERVPLRVATAMAAALRAHHIPVRLVVLPGTLHGGQYKQRVWNASVQYLRVHIAA